MTRQVRYALTALSGFVVLSFSLFVINETNQAVTLARAINPLLAQVVLYGLLIAYAVSFAIPVAILWRVPRALRLPQSEDSPEFTTYLDQLAARLAKNPYLAGQAVLGTDRASIDSALLVLDARATEIIQATASLVFVTTAISQNGRLDGLMVLVTQSRMVWQVVHVYNQRPSFRELIDLYANVAATTFLATQLADLDLTDQVQPIIASAVGVSMAGAVPMATTLATILTHALVDGSANAFLTLRVGVIARRRCSSLTSVQRSVLRRSASFEAAGMLGGIVVKASSVVTSAVAAAAMRPVTHVAGGVRSAASKAASKVRSAPRKRRNADE
jgi:hypothetical protein